MDLVLTSRPSSEISELILQSRLEIAVVSTPLSHSSLAPEPFRSQRVLTFISRANSKIKKREITLERFAAGPLVILTVKDGQSQAEGLLTKLAEKGLDPNVLMTCESPDAVKTVVRTSDAIGIMYGDLVEADFESRNL